MMTTRRISPAVRQAVRQRASFCCEYCYSQEKYCPDPLSVEHIFPRASAGGDDDARRLRRDRRQRCNGNRSHRRRRRPEQQHGPGHVLPVRQRPSRGRRQPDRATPTRQRQRDARHRLRLRLAQPPHGHRRRDRLLRANHLRQLGPRHPDGALRHHGSR
jgi:hypothetical protein